MRGDGASGPDREPIEARLATAGLPPLPRTAWLELDLDALASNLGTIRRLAGPGVRVEPVVKADAYGHGAVPIAQALADAGADGLSVATFDEALELREAGIELPLLVLYPIPPEQVPAAVAARIAVSVGAGSVTERILEAAERATGERAAGGGPALDLQVEIETGLGRGGVLPEDAADLVGRIGRAPGVRLAGVWTHLAAAEDAAGTRAQDARFRSVLGGLVDAVELGPDAVRRHLAGSGGLLGAATDRWDAVRPGLATYGLVPDGLTPPPAGAGPAAELRPVMALLARPVRVVDLPAGHGVSYGPSFVTARTSRIATLPVGYGDGWRRALSDRASALVRGVRVPLVGRVAMDAVMADVTDVPGPPVTAGDEFVLLGRQRTGSIPVSELAATCGTISYEIVTSMSRRLPRVYHAARSPVGVRLLAGWRAEWHASSSGTATSVISRSTPS